MYFLVGGLIFFGGFGPAIKLISERRMPYIGLEGLVELGVFLLFMYLGSILIRKGYEIRKENLRI